MSVDIGSVAPNIAAPTGGAVRATRHDPQAERVRDAGPAGKDAPDSDGKLAALLKRLGVGGPNVDARLSIVQDDVTRDFVYRILNSRTGEVVRQFPHEKTLELLRYLAEQQGLVVDERA